MRNDKMPAILLEQWFQYQRGAVFYCKGDGLTIILTSVLETVSVADIEEIVKSEWCPQHTNQIDIYKINESNEIYGARLSSSAVAISELPTKRLAIVFQK